MKYHKDEWETFLVNCDFTDNELEIIPLLRRGWSGVRISLELSISTATLSRRKDSIEEKISHYYIARKDP